MPALAQRTHQARSQQRSARPWRAHASRRADMRAELYAMGSRDPRIDAYISKSAPFAQPILARVRDAVHAACPGVEETIKWSAPSFVHAGRILAGMAAFKQHASFGFWKHAEVMGEGGERNGMGSYGKLQSVHDLPPRARLLADIRRAAALNEQPAASAVTRRAAARAKPPLQVPAEFEAALVRHARARAAFDAFAPSHRREYVEWIAEAKREATRSRRLAQAIEWLSEGKHRHWKHERS
jgi:uncharacterized protein YdeI (YjbR/CyaY-like superfamily)